MSDHHCTLHPPIDTGKHHRGAEAVRLKSTCYPVESQIGFRSYHKLVFLTVSIGTRSLSAPDVNSTDNNQP